EEGLAGAVSLGDEEANRACEALQTMLHLGGKSARGSGGAGGAAQAARQLAQVDAAGQQAPYLARVLELLDVARTDRGGRGWCRLTRVLVVSPGIGQQKGIGAGPAAQHQRAGCVAIAERHDPAQLRAFGAER